MKKRITLAMLRKKYPYPVRAITVTGYEKDKYCVGGSLCTEMGFKDQLFPKQSELRDAVIQLRGLNYYDMRGDVQGRINDMADAVIRNNDSGDFEAAWHSLGKLLKLRRAARGAEEKR